MRTKLVWAAAGLVLCLGALAAASQPMDEQSYMNDGLWPVEENPAVRVKVGRGRLLTLPAEVERVALADDTLARPLVVSAREVLLTGLKPGDTTVFIWLADGGRMMYPLRIEADLDLDLLRRTLAELDPRIVPEASGDGLSVVLRGDVDDRRVAREATARAETLMEGKAKVLSLLRYPGYAVSSQERLEERLGAALQAIDPRIRFRRIQVGEEPDPTRDTYLLEGRVADVQSLKRAVTLAERQLGGTGSELVAAGEERLQFQRFRGFFGASGGGAGSAAAGGQVLQGSERPPAGLSALVARGLVVTSESGRVVSFLEVDDLPQVMVSIRVVELNRTRARKAGIDWRFDNEHVSIGSFLGTAGGSLPSGGSEGVSNSAARTPRRGVVRPGPSISRVTGGNIVGAFIDKASSVVLAIDYLEDEALARSVAEPNVLTLSGEPATVVVGGEVPIPSTTVTQVTAVQGFFFQDFGVRLDIRPTVVGDDLIALEASPSIVRPSLALGAGDVPGFQVESVQTTARVAAGESLVLGGLLNFEEGTQESRIPGFGWLPGLGRHRRKSRDERELLFVISPRIVRATRPDRPAADVEMPDLDALQLPELDWPEDRKRWRDEFEPDRLGDDGIPPSFAPEESGETQPAGEQGAEAATPAMATESSGGEPASIATEPTPSVSATAVAAPARTAPRDFVVSGRAYPCLNLRAEPGLWTVPIDCYPPGQRLERLEKVEGWSLVLLSSGLSGWMSTAYLDPLPVEHSRWQEVSAEGQQLQRQADEEAAAQRRLEEELEALEADLERVREQNPPPAEEPPGR